MMNLRQTRRPSREARRMHRAELSKTDSSIDRQNVTPECATVGYSIGVGSTYRGSCTFKVDDLSPIFPPGLGRVLGVHC
jgi:hypothetical protein